MTWGSVCGSPAAGPATARAPASGARPAASAPGPGPGPGPASPAAGWSAARASRLALPPACAPPSAAASERCAAPAGSPPSRGWQGALASAPGRPRPAVEPVRRRASRASFGRRRTPRRTTARRLPRSPVQGPGCSCRAPPRALAAGGQAELGPERRLALPDGEPDVLSDEPGLSDRDADLGPGLEPPLEQLQVHRVLPDVMALDLPRAAPAVAGRLHDRAFGRGHEQSRDHRARDRNAPGDGDAHAGDHAVLRRHSRRLAAGRGPRRGELERG